jgi:hypothetical protein
MNASTLNTGMSGDEAAPTDLDGLPPSWGAAADESEDVALRESGGRVGAHPMTPGTGLAQRASEQQLAEWIDAIVDHDERALAS